MSIQRRDRAIHWDYVLSLEEDLARLSRYVDFSGNDAVYSIEIARLLMAACAEVDVVLKGICRRQRPQAKVSSINSYRPIVLEAHPGIRRIEVQLYRYGLSLQPWKNWDEAQPPPWWSANNKVKHQRAERFTEANLTNCLNAVAGLFASVLYFYREMAEHGELLPAPSLLTVPGVMRGGPGLEPQPLYFKLP